ncbi:hypothetical protein M422DRAFT_271395 [Sphaerobolus stellatus SS14]|uniref:Uncharacterized protein n=1 Tax=Sphaerobolus stellatus (strain SS14) TaxID=990650 RepID=A0A0C9UPN2_SPHS4|nr:hypothetical protein M422DRAFT_271395 [Sphaerobolus stellatus SS14]
MEIEEEISEASIQKQIDETSELIKATRERRNVQRELKKKAHDDMLKTKDQLASAQVEKNGICSKKRSEYSCGRLKEDFRTGLREIDEADAQERDPDNFDPNEELRDYSAIDLPTFCVSARDYIRITKQVKGDGTPTCFTKVEDTGIPTLQDWCRHLTVASRQRAVRNFLAHLQGFVNSVRNYVEGITLVKEEDRHALRDLWESQSPDDESNSDEEGSMDAAFWLQAVCNQLEDGIFTTKKVKPVRRNIMGQVIGIIPRLNEEFDKIVEDTIEDLKAGFADGLQSKLEAGAKNAAATALETSDNFASNDSMPWQTYRATLRRNGTFRRCLNTELISPLTRNVAASWARVFEADLFSGFESRAIQLVTKLLQEVEKSAALALRDRAKSQADMALAEGKLAMQSLVTVVRNIMNDQQKDISRCLIPHLQTQLKEGYLKAMEERGKGSLVFHKFIETMRNSIFNGGADTLMEKLGDAADSVGTALNNALADLAKKIEVGMSVLWESPREDPRQIRLRLEAVGTLQVVDKQIALWTAANKQEAAASFVQPGDS